MEKVKVGIIGCGNISSIYLENLSTKFDNIEVTACSDMILERAQLQAEKYGIAKACSVDELLTDSEIEIVVNLTIPKAHADVSLLALEAGKHVYIEKPLSIRREDAQKVLASAKEKGLLVGGAPDTFLGGGIQTCRKLIDDGWIGKPIAATAFMTCHGHENWHPDPEFYYKEGGGPMLDMGPYYLTALIALMGPVKRVTGSVGKTFEERLITSEPKYGTKIKVDVPTHIVGVLDFENGAIGSIITSFDVWQSSLPRIEIYGTQGSISVPDPNTFGGPVKINRLGQNEWQEVPLSHGYTENSRGLGVSDMAYAIRSGQEHRAHSEMTYHVLDIMHGFQDASSEGKHYELKSTCRQPSPLPLE